jgi:hypothetical protein
MNCILNNKQMQQNISLTILNLESLIDSTQTTLDELKESLKFFKKLQKHSLSNEQATLEQATSQSSESVSDTNTIINTTVQTNIDEEQWKDIEVYGIKFNYSVSNHGKIKNNQTKQILQQSLRDGYKSVHLSTIINNERTEKACKIHRLVALMFVENNDPANKTVVNHIDGNKFNNHCKNLEWVSIKENNQHAIDNGLTKITKRRVTQCDLDGNEIAIFESLDAAKKATGIDDGGIVKVCKGRLKTTGGFKWKYTDENLNEQDLTDDELEGFIQINEFPNYLIDRAGRIYSKPYKKFLKTAKTRDNSQEIQLANNGIRKTYLLHNLMADHFLPKDETKKFIFHINRNKSDNRVANLKRVTLSELNNLAKNHKNRQNQQNNGQILFLDV